MARYVHVERGHSLDSFLCLDCAEVSGLTALRVGRWKTVYLDNVDRLGPDDQTRLCRYLESADRSRIIAGAADLWTDVQKGAFSAELFYRLNVIHLVVPRPGVFRPGHTSKPKPPACERIDIERVRVFQVPLASGDVLPVWQVADENGRPHLYFNEDDAMLASR